MTVPCKVTLAESSTAVFTDNVTVSAKDAYDNGVNSVTLDSVTVEGTPKASDTSITVKGTASNGESKTLIIDITAQRNDAKEDGAADVTISSIAVDGDFPASATSVPVIATASNGKTGTDSISIGTQRQNAYLLGVGEGARGVTISSLGVYGSPAAGATSITVQAIASNGQSKASAISIVAQRNNADAAGYIRGWNECRAAIIATQEWFPCYTGSPTVIDKEPCLSPYRDASHYVYTIVGTKP